MPWLKIVHYTQIQFNLCNRYPQFSLPDESISNQRSQTDRDISMHFSRLINLGNETGRQTEYPHGKGAENYKDQQTATLIKDQGTIINKFT